MKYGVRKSSIKKSIKARTTGRVNRTLKSSVNPLYGKKGMGMINNSKKSVYNKVYNKTTFSAVPGISNNSSNNSSEGLNSIDSKYISYDFEKSKNQIDIKKLNKDIKYAKISIIYYPILGTIVWIFRLFEWFSIAFALFCYFMAFVGFGRFKYLTKLQKKLSNIYTSDN